MHQLARAWHRFSSWRRVCQGQSRVTAYTPLASRV
jgi:hypothetical protein